MTIEEICDRMNTVRNGIAHSRLNLNLEAIHLSDLKIIEELLYAMRFQDTFFKQMSRISEMSV